jgi:hypothetical protein
LALCLYANQAEVRCSAGVESEVRRFFNRRVAKAQACKAGRDIVGYVILIRGFRMDKFTSDEVLEQAKANAQALGLVAIGYVREKGLPVDEFLSFVGEKFTLGWESLKGRGARVGMRMFALNMVSVGGTLESLSGDEARAEAVIAGWPSLDLLQAFGVSRGDADRIYAVFQPIADLLELRYEWRRQGDRVTLILSQ